MINQHDAMVSKELGFDPSPANYGLGFLLRGTNIHPNKWVYLHHHSHMGGLAPIQWRFGSILN